MIKAGVLFLILAGLVRAQWGGGGSGGEDRRRATMRGGGGDGGKCTAEVDVDSVAEVTISGDYGSLRTLQGQRAAWRRLECTGPLPRSPRDFRFRGVDGRGRQALVRDPRSNGGRAVIRIEDRDGGRHGYTFDIEWLTTGSGWGGGNTGPGWGGGSGPGTGPGWGGSGWGNNWGNQITYRGSGTGEFYRQGGQHYRISGVDVNVLRSGNVTVVMDTNYGRDALRFSGRIQRVAGAIIYADVRSGVSQGDLAQASGRMEINVNSSRRVNAMRMTGTVAGRPFNLTWRD